MILCEPLCFGVFVAGKDLSEWTQTIDTYFATCNFCNFRLV